MPAFAALPDVVLNTCPIDITAGAIEITLSAEGNFQVYGFAALPDAEVNTCPVNITAGAIEVALSAEGTFQSQYPGVPVASLGTLFQRGDGLSPEAFATVAEIIQIIGPEMDGDFIEATTLDSPAGYDEFIPGPVAGGEVTLVLNFTRAGYLQLLADFEEDNSHNYRIILPDLGATQLDFAAFVVEIPLAMPRDLQINFEVVLEITGQVIMAS